MVKSMVCLINNNSTKVLNKVEQSWERDLRNHSLKRQNLRQLHICESIVNHRTMECLDRRCHQNQMVDRISLDHIMEEDHIVIKMIRVAIHLNKVQNPH